MQQQTGMWWLIVALCVPLALILSIGLYIGLYYCEERMAKRQHKRRFALENELATLQQVECLVVLQHPSEWALSSSWSITPRHAIALSLNDSHPCMLFQLYEGSLKYDTLYDGLAGLFSATCVTGSSSPSACPIHSATKLWSQMSAFTTFVIEVLLLSKSNRNKTELVVDEKVYIRYNRLTSKVLLLFSSAKMAEQLKQCTRDQQFVIRLRSN